MCDRTRVHEAELSLVDMPLDVDRERGSPSGMGPSRCLSATVWVVRAAGADTRIRGGHG